MPRTFKKNQTVGYVALGLLVALLGFTFLMGRRGAAPLSPAAPAAPIDTSAAPVTDQSAATPPASVPEARRRPGEVVAVMEDVVLSPQARLLAERFQCVCGCHDILATCTCDKTPGSHDMKRHLQQLVDAGKSPAEVEAGMIEKYGQGVLP